MKNLSLNVATGSAERLLGEIHKLNYPNSCTWRDWQVNRVNGGRNNLLYRAQGQDLAMAIKFCTPDQRDRAGREYQSLKCLQAAGLEIAPKPILLDRSSYRFPVVVQTWLPGSVAETPPANDSEWRHLLQHLVTIHKGVCQADAMKLPQAAGSMTDAKSGIENIEKQFLLIPEQNRNHTLKALLEKLRSTRFPEWNAAAVGLCRSDPNALNFVRLPDVWHSVDWENGGWGDPAFDIADLMAHPCYLAVPQSRWDWLIDAYANSMSDSEAPRRIRVYYALMIVWWIARLSREILAPRESLADRATNSEREIFTNLARYLALCELCRL